MKNVAFLGVEGSGKTVLTLALVNAFKAHENEGWYLRPDSREAFRFLEQAPKAVSGDALPHQTTALKKLSWSVQLNGQTLRQLDVLDYPGEIYRLAFLDAKDDSEPATFEERVAANKEDVEALLGHLFESDHVFVLFNLADAEAVAKNATNLDAVWVTNACLAYLQKLPNKPSVTLLLTQIDRYADSRQTFSRPEDFVRERLPLIHRNFPDLDVLPISAIGSADSAFGVDNMLLRCLRECDVVESQLSGLRTASRDVASCLDKMRFTAPRCLPIDTLLRAVEKCRTLSAELPWFVALGQLRSEGMLVDAGEQDDIRALAQMVKPIEESSDSERRLTSLSAAIERLPDLEPSCGKSRGLRDRLVKQIQDAIPECKSEISRAKMVRKFCIWAMIALAVFAVVEVVIIIVRAVS